MKIGIYTIHACNNYGAMLQAFATQKALDKIGVNSELVNLYPTSIEKSNKYLNCNNSIKNIVKNLYAISNSNVRLKSQRFEMFHNAMKLSKRYYSIDELYANPPQYDIHLVGSDQVWNLERGFPKRGYFFLDFLTDNQSRVAFASSFGNPNIPEQYYSQLKEHLSKFSRISVREASGVDLIGKATGLQATHVLDPTFMLSKQEWQTITQDEPHIKGRYILYYGFDKNDVCRQIIQQVRSAMNLPIVAISVSTTIPYHVDKFCQSAGPKEFVNLFMHASFVITSSFHGLAFAINFRKNFIVMRTGTRMSRMESLMHEFGLEDRLVESVSQTKKLLQNSIIINYEPINPKITTAVIRSKEWLKTTITALSNK